jgi:uncharacterized membrane protein
MAEFGSTPVLWTSGAPVLSQIGSGPPSVPLPADLSSNGVAIAGGQLLFQLARATAQTLKAINASGSGGFADYSISALSSDASVAVGLVQEGDFEAYRWSSAAGFELLMPTSGCCNALAPTFARGEDVYVSADGSTVVINRTGNVFRWTRQAGAEDLGRFSLLSTRGNAISADGATIVGNAEDTSSPRRRTAVIWTRALGMRRLTPPAPFAASASCVATSMTPDATSIVGTCELVPVVWNAARTGGRLSELVRAAGGTTFPDDSALLDTINDVSSNGKVFIGDDGITTWVARLP